MKTPETYSPIMLSVSLLKTDPALTQAYGREMSPNELAALTHDIESSTMLSPIAVKPTPGEHYYILNGRHRFKVAQALKWSYIPCYIIEDPAAQQAAIFENITRRQLTENEVNNLKVLNQSTKEKERTIPDHLKRICEEFKLHQILKGREWERFIATTEGKAQELLNQLQKTHTPAGELHKTATLPLPQMPAPSQSPVPPPSNEQPSGNHTKHEKVINQLKNKLTNLERAYKEKTQELQNSQISQQAQELESVEEENRRLRQENKRYRETVSAYEVLNTPNQSTKSNESATQDGSIPLAMALVKDRVKDYEKGLRDQKLTIQKVWKDTPSLHQKSLHASLTSLRNTCDTIIKITAPEHPFSLVGEP